MAQFTAEFWQDLRKPMRDRYGGAVLYTGNAQANVLTVHLTENGEPYTGGGTISGTATRANSTTVPLTGSISADGTITVTLIPNCYLVTGYLHVYINVTTGSTVTTVLSVIYSVNATSVGTPIDPSGEITLDVNTLVNRINTATATIPASYETLMYSVAPAYSDLDFPIDAGLQLCWYDGQLYVNNVDIAAEESWTPAHWDACDVSGELAKVAAVVAELEPHFPATGRFVTGDSSATADYSSAIGSGNTASGIAAFAEGASTQSTGGASHSEGDHTTASGMTAHAEGQNTVASGSNSHAEGNRTTASGLYSHAGGYSSVASGRYSHAHGLGVEASTKGQVVFGEYNEIEEATAMTKDYQRGQYAEIVGNGASANARSNARTLDWSGNEALAGDLTINKNGQNEMTVGEELSDLKSAINSMTTATAEDEGKALKAKTVTNGKVTEWEFGEAGGGADIDSIVTVEQTLTGADSSNRKMLMQKDAPFETELTARDYRRIGYVNVKRGEADITKWVYADDEIGVDCVFDNLRVEVIAPDKVPTKNVDICLFTGQSNMSGRGDASQATVCPAGEGYWWHNNQFEQIIDPVGNEGPSTGTMIPAICKAYYDTTNVPIVAVVNAIGGTNIAYWQPDTGAYNNSVNWVNAAKTYAEQNGYTVRHIIMCWCQGENDVADGTTKADYKAAFISMCDGLTEDAGVELFFNIKIGQHKTNTSYDFTAIRAAQDELCQENPNYVNVSDKFRGAPMKDAWHYKQPELNLTGRDAGINMGYYMLTGIKPLYPSYNFGDVFDQNVASSESFDLTGWTYSEGNTGLSLVKYDGTAKKVSIPASTIVNGYATAVRLDATSNLVWGFRDNTTIEEVSIDENVPISLGGDGTYQILSNMFNGCSALKKVTSLPAQNPQVSAAHRYAESMYRNCTNIVQVVFPNNATLMSNICRGCTSLTEIPEIPQTATTLQAAFHSIPIEHLPDIPDSVTSIHTIVYNSTALKSIGRIGKSVTNVTDAFRFCPNLAGTVHIDAEGITFNNQTFSASAIPNITFEVPAGSTTYTSLIAAYPNANVTTFTPD